jgi:hypothetical protein
MKGTTMATKKDTPVSLADPAKGGRFKRAADGGLQLIEQNQPADGRVHRAPKAPADTAPAVSTPQE